MPAWMAVWNFAYSGAPCPATVQQTCTSVWELLKLSTTLAMFGYHAQTETLGASAWTILLVQLVVLALFVWAGIQAAKRFRGEAPPKVFSAYSGR